MEMNQPLLELQAVEKYFPIKSTFLRRPQRFVRAVDGVSFRLFKGQTLGLVGESGCGKSTLGRLSIRLLDPTAGKIFYQGQDLGSVSKSDLRGLRKHVQIVFQDPFSSLNPRMTVGNILSEPFEIHEPSNRRQIIKRVERLLETVGLPTNAFDRYPHEFSGGQRQRIGIARAIALSPTLVVADEPVSALDVSIQSQILNLFSELKKTLGLSYIFVSHDLSVIRHISDVVAVMYLGRIVELADVEDIYLRPRHPYTKILLSSVPQIGSHQKEMSTIHGDVPSPISPPSGCHFHPRCPIATDVCKTKAPVTKSFSGSAGQHQVSCHHAEA
jgi:oligopeptide transport system ATP-binding protein